MSIAVKDYFPCVCSLCAAVPDKPLDSARARLCFPEAIHEDGSWRGTTNLHGFMQAWGNILCYENGIVLLQKNTQYAMVHWPSTLSPSDYGNGRLGDQLRACRSYDDLEWMIARREVHFHWKSLPEMLQHIHGFNGWYDIHTEEWVDCSTSFHAKALEALSRES